MNYLAKGLRAWVKECDSNKTCIDCPLYAECMEVRKFFFPANMANEDIIKFVKIITKLQFKQTTDSMVYGAMSEPTKDLSKEGGNNS